MAKHYRETAEEPKVRAPTTLAEMMDRAKQAAVHQLADVGEVKTMFFCVSESVPPFSVSFPMPPPGPEKDWHVATLRELFKLIDVKMYVAMAEAWSSMQPIAMQFFRPSEAPDRQEVVSLMGADLQGNRMTSVAEIMRDGAGTPSLADWEDADEAGGLMASLLEPDWAAAAPAMPLNVGFPVN
jgi:hypothetical protein